MKFKHLFCCVVTIMCTSAALYAQPENNESNKPGDVKLNLLYDYSMPLGDFKNDYISKNSPRGFSADILYWFKPQWGIGGSFGYRDYYQKHPRDLYKLSDGSDISAVLSNSMQVIPIMIKTMYAPTVGNKTFIEPYVTAGTGINIISYGQYVGEFGGTKNSVGFAAMAGAGIKIPFGKTRNAGFMLGAAYNFSPYNKNNIDNLNTVNLQAGFQFRLKK